MDMVISLSHSFQGLFVDGFVFMNGRTLRNLRQIFEFMSSWFLHNFSSLQVLRDLRRLSRLRKSYSHPATAAGGVGAHGVQRGDAEYVF
eukprot:6180748-Pleurochrysis_carterae.AAC.3